MIIAGTKFKFGDAVKILDETKFVNPDKIGWVVDFIIQKWWQKLFKCEQKYIVGLSIHDGIGEYFDFKESELKKFE
jgi:hypothetical protein